MLSVGSTDRVRPVQTFPLGKVWSDWSAQKAKL